MAVQKWRNARSSGRIRSLDRASTKEEHTDSAFFLATPEAKGLWHSLVAIVGPAVDPAVRFRGRFATSVRGRERAARYHLDAEQRPLRSVMRAMFDQQ